MRCKITENTEKINNFAAIIILAFVARHTLSLAESALRAINGNERQKYGGK
jgi:hypothetical protein